MPHYSKITIVTPSYHQGAFIEETIQSVIGQQYPNLEYIIIDGGSTDNTVEIIKKYEKYLTFWVSEKDKGQSHAINKGFIRATGDIMAWLNSDDMYLPGTLAYINKTLNAKEAALCFGNCIHFREEADKVISSGSDVVAAAQKNSIDAMDFIIQPATFWTKIAWMNTGALREDLHYAFDWEWFIRARNAGVNFLPVARPLSVYRFHEGHKTSSGSESRIREIEEIYNLHNPRMAQAFKKLLKEDLELKTFQSKLLFFLFKKMNKARSVGDILKFTTGRKYADVSVAEINDLKEMIGKR